MHHTYVTPSGDPSAKLGIVGEQPGHQEVRARPPRPFIGPAGQGLDECLAMTKIQRRELYITNVIKDLDAPLAHYINLDTRGKWTISADGYDYINELGVELRKLNLNIVVAMGNIALLALTNRVGITKWRGSILDSTLVPGLKVIGTFHPSTFIPPKFKFLNKPIVCEDLMRAKYESQFKEIKRISRQIYIRPDFNQTINTLRNCYRLGKLGQIIGFDIEVINKEVAGYEILNQLLNAYGKMAFNYFEGNLSTYDQLLLNILPETVKLSNTDLYQNLGAICLYISKLSDTNAMLLHQKLKGQILQ